MLCMQSRARTCPGPCQYMRLQVYLHELEQTAGTASIPTAALRVLNSKACRYAVMFGALQCTGLRMRARRRHVCFPLQMLVQGRS